MRKLARGGKRETFQRIQMRNSHVRLKERKQMQQREDPFAFEDRHRRVCKTARREPNQVDHPRPPVVLTGGHCDMSAMHF